MRKHYRAISYSEEAIEAAVDLGYGKEVIRRLKKAKSDNEITRIMKDAREGKFDKKVEDKS